MPLHEGESLNPSSSIGTRIMTDDEMGDTNNKERKREYRGIFSSSICDMFNSTQTSKTDACALACCGVWLWERNQFLLTGKYPKFWRQRPMEVVIMALLIAAAFIWSLNPQSMALQICLMLAIAMMLWRLLSFEYARSGFRHGLAVEEYKRLSLESNLTKQNQDLLANPQQKLSNSDEKMSDFDTSSDQDKKRGLLLYLRQNWKEINGAHNLCDCVRDDTQITVDHKDEDEKPDLCQYIWKFLTNACCNTCCMCWCLCCGICAIAQEHRHLVKVLPDSPELWQRDYITMQPWSEYFPKILELRNSENMKFLKHCRALSDLSLRICQAVGVFFVCAISLAFLPVKFDKWQIAVMFGTLLEPIVILFLVYWFWNRLDISMDAIIKYFGSGFFLCSIMVMVYEMLVSILASIAVILYSIVGTSILVAFGEVDLDKLETLDERDFGFNNSTNDTGTDIRWTETLGIPVGFVISIAVFWAFCDAFFVAALIEELFKYLSFWMVEHPDLERDVALDPLPSSPLQSNKQDHPREDMGLLPRGDDTMPLTFVESKPHPYSLESRGAAITVAMVAVATGFSCAENFIYVFVYTDGIAAEANTLIMRALFPVHPLCAAIQSIAVVRRDLENDTSIGVGRILLGAWLLHGIFDFLLMTYSAISGVADPSSGSKEEQSVDTVDWIVMGCVILIPLIGLEYYFYHAQRQTKRLRDLDSGRISTNTAAPVTAVI